jgi:hypothetical protein
VKPVEAFVNLKNGKETKQCSTCRDMYRKHLDKKSGIPPIPVLVDIPKPTLRQTEQDTEPEFPSFREYLKYVNSAEYQAKNYEKKTVKVITGRRSPSPEKEQEIILGSNPTIDEIVAWAGVQFRNLSQG